MPIVKYLVEKCGCTEYSEAIENTLFENTYPIVRYFVEKCNYNIIVRNYNLHLAIMNNNLKLVKYFLEKCVFVDNKNDALCSAVSSKNKEIIDYLIRKCGCDVNYVNSKGFNAVFNHIETPEILKLLVEEYGFKPNKKTLEEGCILNNSKILSNLQFTKYLVENLGVNANSVDENGMNAVYFAYENLETLKYLVEECGCDPNQKTVENKNVLHYQAGELDINILKYLIEECGCDPNQLCYSGLNALHNAAMWGNIQTIDYLIEKCGCDINQMEGGDGCTALDEAIIQGSTEVIEFLKSKGGLTYDDLHKEKETQEEDLNQEA